MCRRVELRRHRGQHRDGHRRQQHRDRRRHGRLQHGDRRRHRRQSAPAARWAPAARGPAAASPPAAPLAPGGNVSTGGTTGTGGQRHRRRNRRDGRQRRQRRPARRAPAAAPAKAARRHRRRGRRGRDDLLHRRFRVRHGWASSRPASDNFDRLQLQDDESPERRTGGALVDSRTPTTAASWRFTSRRRAAPVLLERPLPSGTNHLFVRAYFYLMSSWASRRPSSDNHETLMGISADPASAEHRDPIRRDQRAPSERTGPDRRHRAHGGEVEHGRRSSPANAWHCIEVEFAANAAYNALYAWSDGHWSTRSPAARDWQNGALARQLDERHVRRRRYSAGRASAARRTTSGWTTSPLSNTAASAATRTETGERRRAATASATAAGASIGDQVADVGERDDLAVRPSRRRDDRDRRRRRAR